MTEVLAILFGQIAVVLFIEFLKAVVWVSLAAIAYSILKG